MGADFHPCLISRANPTLEGACRRPRLRVPHLCDFCKGGDFDFRSCARRASGNQAPPGVDFNFLACFRIWRIPAGAARRNASARTAETFSATATLMKWFRDTPSDLATLRASAITDACSLRGVSGFLESSVLGFSVRLHTELIKAWGSEGQGVLYVAVETCSKDIVPVRRKEDSIQLDLH